MTPYQDCFSLDNLKDKKQNVQRHDQILSRHSTSDSIGKYGIHSI